MLAYSAEVSHSWGTAHSSVSSVNRSTMAGDHATSSWSTSLAGATRSVRSTQSPTASLETQKTSAIVPEAKSAAARVA